VRESLRERVRGGAPTADGVPPPAELKRSQTNEA